MPSQLNKIIRPAAVVIGLLLSLTGMAEAQSKQPKQPDQANAGAQVAPPPKLPAGLSDDELNTVINQQVPLSPSQIIQVRQAAQDAEVATKARIGKPPLPVSGTIPVSFAPGKQPQVIRVAPGYTSALVFTDVTGAPWIVQKAEASQKGQLKITSAADEGGSGDAPPEKTNMFTVTPLVDVVNTNIVVYLEKAPAPIVMIVASGQPEVDFRLDVSVQGRGPSAVMPTLSRNVTDSVPAELTSMVSGLTPSQAKPLKVISSDVPDVQAWVIGQRMYVRARANVLAPPVPKDGKVATGPDGTKVFELPLAPEVLLMAGGEVGKLRLGGFPPPSLLPEKNN